MSRALFKHCKDAHDQSQHEDIPATVEELNGKLAVSMTISTATTQNEQPHDNTTTANEHAEPLRQLMQERTSAPKDDRQTTKTPA